MLVAGTTVMRPGGALTITLTTICVEIGAISDYGSKPGNGGEGSQPSHFESSAQGSASARGPTFDLDVPPSRAHGMELGPPRTAISRPTSEDARACLNGAWFVGRCAWGLDEIVQAMAGAGQPWRAEIVGPNSRGGRGGALSLLVPRARRLWSLAAVVVVLSALGHVLGKPRAHRPRAAPDAFSSPQACQDLAQRGQRLARPPGTARFASWNLRWFPDGEPREGAGKTDLTWLSCALSWLDVDVLAVQEMKQTPGAERALAQLLVDLNRVSGGRYVARLDDCGSRVSQHVGLIWNEARVAADAFETVAALNPRGSACQDQLRPGLSARLRVAGGLDLTVVSAHFKSKTDARAFALREKSFGAVPGALKDLASRSRDTDVLLLGDLNTMGCRDCTPQVSATDEQARVRQSLSRAGLSLLPADAAGTEMYGGRATLLDHAVAVASMRELPAAARVHVAGFCAASDAKSDARRALSDHCPIVLDLLDRDLD